MPDFASLEAEYDRLWDSMTIKLDKASAVDAIAKKLIAHKETYEAVETDTGVPWYVIAAWHNRESDANFKTQLAQGDPLGSVSTHVPAGRGPFSTWEEGAHDALVNLKHLDQITDWSPARICYETERYNGFGYRNNHPEVLSPYLWSFSNHYTAGKYIADGKFSSSTVDKQCGAIPIMKRIVELEGIDDDATVSPDAKGRSFWEMLADLFAKLFGRKPAEPEEPEEPEPTSGRPRWLVEAIKDIGFHETGTNRGIEQFIKEGKIGTLGDPWCAIFTNAKLEECGVPGTRSAMARSYETNKNFVRLSGPALGAVATFWRGSKSSGSGHVNFYAGTTPDGRHVGVGGNQSDAVTAAYMDMGRHTGWWWPKGEPLPRVGAVQVSGLNAVSSGKED